MRRVLVPVKSVPLGPPTVRLTPDASWIDAGEWQLDPINEVAVEWGVRLHEAGVVAEARAVSVGGAPAEVARRAALARGCTSALRITPDGVAQPDVAGTAALLAAAARRDGADVLAFGYESYDASSGALPAATAAMLGWPLVSRARAGLLEADSLVAIRERGGASEAVHAPLPAAVSFVEGEIVGRHPRLADAIAARRAAIPCVSAKTLTDVDPSDWTAGLRGLEPTPGRPREARRVDADTGVRTLAALVDEVRAENGGPPPARAPSTTVTADVSESRARPAGRYLVAADGPDAADLVLAALPSDVDGWQVTCLLFGCDAEAVRARPPGIAGARVVVAPQAQLDAPADGIGPRVLKMLGTGTVLLLDSSQPARDLAGWLAAAAGARLAWAVERVEPFGGGVRVSRIVNSGEARLVQVLDTSAPAVLLTKTSTLAARDPGGPASIETASFHAPRTVARPMTADRLAERPRITGRQIVVAVGRGIRGPEHVALFRLLADELGAALGASRAVVDQGWLPFAHQVGQTGSAVAPALYIGFGISGAVQHLVGMRESRTIVAVNTDRHAPLCDVADIVVEADAVEVARALLADVSGGGVES